MTHFPSNPLRYKVGPTGGRLGRGGAGATWVTDCPRTKSALSSLSASPSVATPLAIATKLNDSGAILPEQSFISALPRLGVCDWVHFPGHRNRYAKPWLHLVSSGWQIRTSPSLSSSLWPPLALLTCAVMASVTLPLTLLTSLQLIPELSSELNARMPLSIWLTIPLPLWCVWKTKPPYWKEAFSTLFDQNLFFKLLSLLPTAGGVALPLKFLIQPPVCFNGERGQEKQRVFITVGYLGSQGGRGYIRRVSLLKGGSEIQPSAFLPAAWCCLCWKILLPQTQRTTIPLNASPMINYVWTNNNSDKTTHRDKAVCVGEEREK